ncbi:inactive leucine-rich repeat receptor-like protein kinase CORYNE [Gossypium australe]|uniref:Inactive leucine-rich repeat receptor-like protein kinase CORYNE n=1 Tax=Gossypium australe TaxID=47621 RepID=A0A5B6V3I1_9ROSI|nr:inactive leucine-rich repeat receptor-like protein kinase CORYNE [Gossypium australe]
MAKMRGCIVTVALLLLLLLCLHQTPVECKERLIRQLSSQPSSATKPQEFKIGFKRVILSIVLGILTGLIGAILFALLIKIAVQYINQTPFLKGPVIFSPKISSKTLQSALANENQLLGSSSNGKYYKTVLDNGLTVAVKVLEPFDSGSPEMQSKSVKRRIQQELEVLASLRHRHLRSLRAYVRESDRFSLVYDYMPMGSLEDAMNGVRQNHLELRWDVRLRIAVGVIKGLQYLHFTCVPQILHYNLKPTNVMLDAEFEPRYTDKSDIFSFGMILGVLLTGRYPTDSFFREAVSGGSLGQWLRHLQQAGEAHEALDKSILGEEVEEDEMLMAVRIACVCLSDSPVDRPSSDELVTMLTQLHKDRIEIQLFITKTPYLLLVENVSQVNMMRTLVDRFAWRQQLK